MPVELARPKREYGYARNPVRQTEEQLSVRLYNTASAPVYALFRTIERVWPIGLNALLLPGAEYHEHTQGDLS